MAGGKRPTRGGGRRSTMRGGARALTNRNLRRILKSRPEMLYQKVHRLIDANDMTKYRFGDVTELSVTLIKLTSDQLRRLERSYAHAYGLGNPYATGGDYNLYKLRDDIRAKLPKGYADPLISKVLQKKNPMPKRVTLKQAAQQNANATWPATDRDLSKKRLSHPNVWPPRYRSSKASFDGVLRNKIQGWGEWVLENYQFLYSKNNPASFHLRINFNWPKQQDRPTSLNDDTHYGDLALFADVANQFDQVSVVLNQMAKAAFYSRGGAAVATYLKKLQQVKEVFSKTKGQTARRMLQSITERLKRAEKGTYDE